MCMRSGLSQSHQTTDGYDDDREALEELLLLFGKGLHAGQRCSRSTQWFLMCSWSAIVDMKVEKRITQFRRGEFCAKFEIFSFAF
jgi:hypothetical protein